jgi:hypothetical protein
MEESWFAADGTLAGLEAIPELRRGKASRVLMGVVT